MSASGQPEDGKGGGADADGPGINMGGPQIEQGLPDVRRKILARVDHVTQDIMQLTCYEKNTYTCAVANHHRARDELGDLPKVQQSGEKLHYADEEAQIHRELEGRDSGRRVCGDGGRYDETD
jgi:hypothetical protein